MKLLSRQKTISQRTSSSVEMQFFENGSWSRIEFEQKMF